MGHDYSSLSKMVECPGVMEVRDKDHTDRTRYVCVFRNLEKERP